MLPDIRQAIYTESMAKPAFNMERFFQALGDTTRLRILNLVGNQELCVCYFVQVLGQPQPKISRHLAYLRNTGLVTFRREGTWMQYRIATPDHRGARRLLKETLRWMEDDPDMIADRKRLSKACCSPEKFAGLQGAPAPVSCC
jgi:ArsR family transcriptional regulator